MLLSDDSFSLQISKKNIFWIYVLYGITRGVFSKKMQKFTFNFNFKCFAVKVEYMKLFTIFIFSWV